MALVGNALSIGSKTYFEYSRHVRAVFESGSSGHYMVGCDFVADFYSNNAFYFVWHFVVDWRRANVWAPDDFNVLICIFGEDEHGVVDEEFGWHVDFWVMRCLRFWGQSTCQ